MTEAIVSPGSIQNTPEEGRHYEDPVKAKPEKWDSIETLRLSFSTFLEQFEQEEYSGGLWTTPGNRLLLLGLAVSMGAEDILELGYDAGVTTEIFAMSGAKRVVGVDNLSEYGGVEPKARQRLSIYPNVELHNGDALDYLHACSDESFDIIFIDDYHGLQHVMAEAQEVRRVLRPGGFAIFHDTIIHALWEAIATVLPDWQQIELPSMQRKAPYQDQDFGMGLVRKPYDRSAG